MALETLKVRKTIGGFEVGYSDTDSGQNANCPIYIDHIKNQITFRIQDGPVKEAGVNGCQVDTMIETAKLIIEGLNKNFPCRENLCAITKLDEALHWLNHRTQRRQREGVEGFSKETVVEKSIHPDLIENQV